MQSAIVRSMNKRWYCRDDTLPDRFGRKVEKAGADECWLWTGGIDRSEMGHGWIGTSKGLEHAHRVAYRLHHGEIEFGADVLHSCNQPRCVNPAHLQIGSAAENSEDMLRSGRQISGANQHHWAAQGRKLPDARAHRKLADDQVCAIRADPRGGKRLATVYGMYPSYLDRVKRGLARSDVI